MTRLITEVKHFLDGREQQFRCEAVIASNSLAVVRFRHPAARMAGGFHFPEGASTFGFFWAGRYYNLYRFTAPDGTVIARRIDVVRDVHLTSDRIDFTDLLLDAWLPPDGPLRFEDDEEVTEATASLLLNPRDLAIIAGTRALLQRRYSQIIAETEEVLATVESLNGR